MVNSLIPADQPFAVIAALLAIALFGFWAEQQRWGRLISGTVWVIIGSIITSNIGLIPKSSPTYGFIFTYLVPVLVPLFLIHANVRKIISESGRVGIAFILSCMGTVGGTIAACMAIDLGNNEAYMAGIFAATYTGGSLNFATVIQSTGFHDVNLIASASAVDNLLGTLFLAVLAIMPTSRWLMTQFAQRNHSKASEPASTTTPVPQTKVTGFSLTACLVFALSVVAISDFLVSWLAATFVSSDFDFSILRYVFITVFSIIPATLFPAKMQTLHGSESLGLLIAFVFFAAIAAGADIVKMISAGPSLFIFVSILLLGHMLIVFVGGALLSKLLTRLGKANAAPTLPELIIASNAAILGPTTAPALAMAKGWTALVTPGVLAGVAGYIVGTPLGLAIITLLTK
jgi:uncharacterized membrane protein